MKNWATPTSPPHDVLRRVDRQKRHITEARLVFARVLLSERGIAAQPNARCVIGGEFVIRLDEVIVVCDLRKLLVEAVIGNVDQHCVSRERERDGDIRVRQWCVVGLFEWRWRVVGRFNPVGGRMIDTGKACGSLRVIEIRTVHIIPSDEELKQPAVGEAVQDGRIIEIDLHEELQGPARCIGGPRHVCRPPGMTAKN
jgi:hypothetical protein